MEHLPNRKHPRLKSDIYDKAGVCFVTICTKERSPCLGKIVWDRSDVFGTAHCALSEIGEVVQKYLCGIENAYPDVHVDTFMIMPDHVHLLLCFQKDALSSVHEDAKSPATYTRLVRMVRSCKTLVTKEIGYSIWQASFYDSILPEGDALAYTRQYILHNPARWALRYGVVPE